MWRCMHTPEKPGWEQNLGSKFRRWEFEKTDGHHPNLARKHMPNVTMLIYVSWKLFKENLVVVSYEVLRTKLEA
jgi:hypothetical protein